MQYTARIWVVRSGSVSCNRFIHDGIQVYENPFDMLSLP